MGIYIVIAVVAVSLAVVAALEIRSWRPSNVGKPGRLDPRFRQDHGHGAVGRFGISRLSSSSLSRQRPGSGRD